MMKRIFAIIIVLCLVFSGLITIIPMSPNVDLKEINEASGSRASHAPIRINSDSEFSSMATSESWPGSGTLASPYVIQNYDINGSGKSWGIFIGNTTVYFTIQNCEVHHVTGRWDYPYQDCSGIALYNVDNGLIKSNSLSLKITEDTV